MKLKTVAKLISVSIIVTSMSYATNPAFNKLEDFTPCGAEEVQTYNTMSTKEIEAKVEICSIKGELPFELGLELIKRWSNV